MQLYPVKSKFKKRQHSATFKTSLCLKPPRHCRLLAAYLTASCPPALNLKFIQVKFKVYKGHKLRYVGQDVPSQKQNAIITS